MLPPKPGCAPSMRASHHAAATGSELWHRGRQSTPRFHQNARQSTPSGTCAQVASRVENLYFTYLFTLRAVQKAGPLLAALEYSSGSAAKDRETQQLVSRLVRTTVDLPRFRHPLLVLILVFGHLVRPPRPTRCSSSSAIWCAHPVINLNPRASSSFILLSGQCSLRL